jgi:hypothetical protein
VGKGESPEIGRAVAGGGEGVRGRERPGRVTISSPPAGSADAVAPVASAVPSVVAAAVAGEESGEGALVSFRSASLGMLSMGLGRVSKTWRNGGFRRGIRRGAIPDGFYRTSYKIGPGLNGGAYTPIWAARTGRHTPSRV